VDSKSIYIAAQNTAKHVVWLGSEHEGWCYVGDGKLFDVTKAQKAIDLFFAEERIYLSVNRHKGFELQTSKAGWELQKHITADAWLVNTSFKKIMAFSKIGVYRCGQISS